MTRCIQIAIMIIKSECIKRQGESHMEQYGLKIIWTARYDYYPCQCLKNHKHNYYQMIYFIDGHGVFLYDSQRLAFDSGDIFLLNPGFFMDLSMIQAVPIKH